MDYNIRRHIGYYLGLILVLVAGIVLISVTSSEPTIQVGVVILMSIFYIVWAVFHHRMHHDIHTKVVLEYILIAAVAVSLVSFTLLLLS